MENSHILLESRTQHDSYAWWRVFYVELGSHLEIRQFSESIKKIIGYYEERDALYGEIKLAGFNNGQVTLSLGNTDFYNFNTFKPILNIEFSFGGK